MADLNQDGYDDLVVAHHGVFGSSDPDEIGKKVSIFLSNGSSGFSTSSQVLNLWDDDNNTTDPQRHKGITIADVDGDGAVDILVGHDGGDNGEASLSIFFNQYSDPVEAQAATALFDDTLGDWGDHNRIDVVAGKGVSDIVTIDRDSDGAVDIIATANHDSNNVSVLRLNSSNQFVPAGWDGTSDVREIELGIDGVQHLNGLVAGDFNGDGHIDLAVGINGNGINNQGVGGVRIISGAEVNNQFVFRSNTLTTLSTGEKGTWDVVAGDFNHDGTVDLATANIWYDKDNNGNVTETHSSVVVLYGSVSNGTINYTSILKETIAVEPGVGDLVVADFNLDGRDDLAMNFWTNHGIADPNIVGILYQQSGGKFLDSSSNKEYETFAMPEDTAGVTGGWGIAAGDFDGDGSPDLAAASFATNSVRVFRNLHVFDYDDDNDIDKDDVEIMRQAFGAPGGMDFSATPWFDVNGDGQIDSADYFALLDLADVDHNDVNNDGVLDREDMQDMQPHLSGNASDMPWYDVNQNGVIDAGNFASDFYQVYMAIYNYSQAHGTTGIVFGDANLDGDVNGFDVDPFIAILLGNASYQIEADMNGDGVIDGFDVDPFIEWVLNGGPPA